MRRFVPLVVVVMMLAACTRSAEEPPTTTAAVSSTSTLPPSTTTTLPPSTITTQPPSTTTNVPPVSTGAMPRVVPAFANLRWVPLMSGGPGYTGPSLPDTLRGVIMQPGTVPADAEAALLANGFVVIPSRIELMHGVYHSYETEEVYFVTTDVGYHFWHLVFDKVLREVEARALLPVLETLVLGGVTDARSQRDDLAGTDLADAADRAAQWWEATADLLGVDVGPIGSRAQAEVDLATAAIDLTESPLTSFGPCDVPASVNNCVDYSLFKPRGHYTRSADLERFFRTMSFLGQSAFFATDARSLQVGLLVSRVLARHSDLAGLWRQVYEPTAFLAGLADDYTPMELAGTAESVSPGIMADPIAAGDLDLVDRIGTALLAGRDVGIDPEAASVRVMGARFVIDSFVYDQLVAPNVGGEDAGWRRMASPLDLAAALGSGLAYRIQDQAGETAYRNYDLQLEKMRDLLDGRTADDWAATVYDGWVYALQPKLASRDRAYPEFMRNPAWEAKDLQTALGSYAELKHDTILYAKQSFAAEADYTPLREPARHWVEPDPVTFERLSAVAGLIQEGMSARGLLPDEQDRTLTDLRTMLDRFARIATDELAGRPISDADNDWLGGIGSTLEGLWFQTTDLDPTLNEPKPEDMESAIVADIARNTEGYLEIGTGWVDEILVLVPNDAGHFQVARGSVYSYYEFWREATDGRLTDEEWRQLLRDDDQPDRPQWQSVLFPGAGEALGSGLFCRDVAAAGYPAAEAVGYWLREGRPERMDADRNGIPCETVFDMDAFLEAGRSYGTSVSCRDVAEAGGSVGDAVSVWLAAGMPDRMDADRNGIPCETVFDVTGFLWFDR